MCTGRPSPANAKLQALLDGLEAQKQRFKAKMHSLQKVCLHACMLLLSCICQVSSAASSGQAGAGWQQHMNFAAWYC